MSGISCERWLPVVDSFRILNRDYPQFFPSLGAWRRHLCRRNANGLARLDCVRESPLYGGRQLIVNVERVRSWVLAEPQEHRAA
jgi:hypothetical protein